MDRYDSGEYRRFTSKSEADKNVHTLEGILKGIVFDGNISENEISELINWCQLNRIHVDKPPFDEIINLLSSAAEGNELTEDQIEDIFWFCNNYKSDRIFYDEVTSAMQVLQGILHGILADNQMDKKEIYQLKNWMEKNANLSGTYPYDEIYSLVVSSLKDEVFDDTWRNILKAYFGEFIDTKYSANIHRTELDRLKETIKIGGICAINPDVVIKNKTFCFTGTSSRTIRSEIKEIIEQFSGNFSNNVTKAADYLVIGDEGNPCWVFACYGRKVEKAIAYRKEGQALQIIHENDFWDAIENKNE